MSRPPVRGELWTVAGGIYVSKPRPALVVQDHVFEDTASLTVLPLTSSVVDAPFLRIRVPSNELTGLARESDVMIEKLTTVRRQNVIMRIGRLSAGQLVDVERATMVFLGLAR